MESFLIFFFFFFLNQNPSMKHTRDSIRFFMNLMVHVRIFTMRMNTKTTTVNT